MGVSGDEGSSEIHHGRRPEDSHVRKKTGPDTPSSLVTDWLWDYSLPTQTLRSEYVALIGGRTLCRKL